MLVGVRTIAAEPAARVPVAFCALVSFVYGTDTVLFVGVSEEQLGTGPNGFGLPARRARRRRRAGGRLVNRLRRSPRLALDHHAGAVVYCAARRRC